MSSASRVEILCIAGLLCTSCGIKAQGRLKFSVPDDSAQAGIVSGSEEGKTERKFSGEDNLLDENGSSAQSGPARPSRPAHAAKESQIGQVGIGVKISTLGIGFAAGVSIAPTMNIRGGFNAFSYARTFNYDGISYKGNLDFRNGDVLLDWFPFQKGFHLSGGALIYNGNKIHATASAPAGKSFTLGSNTYYSGSTNPVTGTGDLNFRKAAPMVLFGFGNLVPRTRHFSFVFDAGVAFVGIPQTKLALQGTACADAAQTNCVNAATDPTIQSNVIAQQTKLNNKAKSVQYWPVISIGFGYRF